MKTLFRIASAGSRTSAALMLCLSVFTVLLINEFVANLHIKGEPIPEYGTWTGIQTLEWKLRLLREFARQGPVDAIILGSSISDHGISAAVLSRDLTIARGKPFRVFNLSSGAAGMPTVLTLYRLAAAVAKPKQIWLAYPVEMNLGDGISKASPDYALQRAPVGIALRHPLLLPLSLRVFQLPLVSNAAALRDWVMYGKFVNRQTSHLDIFGMDAFGDTRDFLYYAGPVSIKQGATGRRQSILSAASRYAAATDEKAKAAVYFSRTALEAGREIRALAARDHCAISILAHDTAGGFATQDSEYLAAGEPFYRVLSGLFGVSVIDVRASFHLAGGKFSDAWHLNSIGADEISALMAAKIANRPSPQFSDYAAAPKVRESQPVPNITPYTAVILRRPSDPTRELQLRYLEIPGYAPVTPHTRIQIVVLLPDNRTVAMPARLVGRNEVMADTSAMPLWPDGQLLLVQPVTAGAKWGSAISWPLTSYRWSAAPTQLPEEVVTRVSAGASSYTPLDGVRASWAGIDSPTPKDWLGVFPVGGDIGTRLSMQMTGGGAAGALDLPPNPTAKAGQYEVRLYENGGWNLMASSKPFSIVPLAVTLESDSKKVSRGGRVRAIWSGLGHNANKDDWVGLFPKGGPPQPRLDVKLTEGRSEGAVELTVPVDAPVADYELRLYAAGGWNLLATSEPFKVAASRVRLTVDRPGVTPGGVILARWSDMDSPEKDDWIGLFPKGRQEKVRTLYHRTAGAASGELSFAIPPETTAGEYEFRLYSHDSWQLVATSGPLRIGAGASSQPQSRGTKQ